MTRSGGEALPSILFVPLPPGGPLPRPPRQQHSKDRRNPPLPLDFLVPSGVEPATGVPSPSLCCEPGDDPITNINVSSDTAVHAVSHSLIRASLAWRQAFSRLYARMLLQQHVSIVYLRFILTINTIQGLNASRSTLSKSVIIIYNTSLEER